jgi:hypothetical protein
MKLGAALALATAILAAAAAAAPPVTLTLSVTPTSVGYGKPVSMSGVLSTQRANQTISIEATTCGTTKTTKAATPKTAANGAYKAAVTPTIGASYSATYKRVKSPATAVTVRPLLKLIRVKRGSFTAQLTAAQAFTGKVVLFQRYSKLKKRWVRVKKVTLTSSAPGATRPAIVTSASFKSRIARGTRVRLGLTNGQAAPCYVRSVSASLRA